MPTNCTCRALMTEMNALGPEGCRQRKDDIVTRIKANAKKWGLTEKLGNYASAAWKSVTTGLALKVNWLDPIPGLVDVAIERAEAVDASKR